EPSDEHLLSVLKLNLPDEPRAHTLGSRMSRKDRSDRCVDDIEMNARTLRRRRDKDYLFGLGHSAVEHLVVRHDNRQWSCDLTRWMRAGTLPLDCEPPIPPHWGFKTCPFYPLASESEAGRARLVKAYLHRISKPATSDVDITFSLA